MKKAVLNITVISLQILIVVMFCTSLFSDTIEVKKQVSMVHNSNLNKIADSVSLLFLTEEEQPEEIIEDDIETTLISLEEEIIKEEETVQEEEPQILPTLLSIDASKYKSNPAVGFVVTDNNRRYELEGDDFNLVAAVVAAEYEKSRDDALAVISVILNRCDSPSWSSWAGPTPVDQVTKPNQFEVYTINSYKKYMPGGAFYNTEHYAIAKQAVIDAISGIRNNKYDSFRSWSYITSSGDYYSYNYIVEGGNRYK